MQTQVTRPKLWFAIICCVIAARITGLPCHAEIIGFEDLTLPAANTFYNGNPGNPPINTPVDGTFTSGSATFVNTFTRLDFGSGPFDTWEGWSYSNVTDQTTAGFGNQYSAWNPTTGGGTEGSPNFGISFGAGAWVQLPEGSQFLSVDLTNSTYAGLSMLNGDAFSKKFGGATGADPDFFQLKVTGRHGGPTGSIVYETDFYLADYRFSDSADDYIVDTWTTLNLSVHGAADTLEFGYASSDVGTFGINTPLYFAADNFHATSVPEPSAWFVLMIGAILLARRTRIG
jgi:Domain of unknown function (DUF4465)